METLQSAGYVYFFSTTRIMDTQILNVVENEEELKEVEETEDFVYTDDEVEDEVFKKDEGIENNPLEKCSSPSKKPERVKRNSSGLSRQRGIRRDPRKQSSDCLPVAAAQLQVDVSDVGGDGRCRHSLINEDKVQNVSGFCEKCMDEILENQSNGRDGIVSKASEKYIKVPSIEVSSEAEVVGVTEKDDADIITTDDIVKAFEMTEHGDDLESNGNTWSGLKHSVSSSSSSSKNLPSIPMKKNKKFSLLNLFKKDTHPPNDKCGLERRGSFNTFTSLSAENSDDGWIDVDTDSPKSKRVGKSSGLHPPSSKYSRQCEVSF